MEKKSILVIEDDQEINLLLKSILEQENYHYYYKHSCFLVYKYTRKQKILNKRDNNMITRILTLYLSS